MPRKVPEWIGKTDDTPIPARVKIRILERQHNRCWACGRKPLRFEYDHAQALINGGENRENNLKALCQPCHALKTNADKATKKKIARTTKKHYGATEKKPWHPTLKRRMDGRVVNRVTGEEIGR